MADNQGVFAGGDPLAVGSYSRLLFSDDEMLGLQQTTAGIFAAGDSYSFTGQSQKMLCFGDFQNECELMLPQKSEITCNLSATSSANNGKIKKKRSDCENEAVNQNLSTGTGAPAAKRRGVKKNNSAGNFHPKVKKGKEKLGERITALQQLVSPFGKTDTASVLHEAVGYIKFLHDQVQVLCSPYLQTPLSSSTQPPHLHQAAIGENLARNDLRSRGLCLVPVESTMHVANTNGADLWSPAVGMEKNGASEQH